MTLLAVVLLQPATSTLAQSATAADQAVTVPTEAEAWYNTTPVPVSDLPVPLPTANPYEEDTLHVRIAGGQENARTYLSLDLATVPFTAQITGGILTLPLAPSEAESEDDKLARFQACLSAPPENGVSGSFQEPPEIDCKTKAGAIFVGKPKPHFLIDLGPFADSLVTGGLALVPTDKAREEGDTWHVVFYGKNNESEGADPITAEVLLTDSGIATSPEDQGPPFLQPDTNDPPSVSDDGGGFGAGSLNLGAPSSSITQPDETVAGTSESRQPQAIAAPSTVPVVERGTTYTVVWALPLVLLVMGIYFSSALTREIAGPRRRRRTI